jgi:thiol:disulfide interchange protein DsbC
MKTMKTNVMSFNKTNVISLSKKLLALLLFAAVSTAHAGEKEIRQSLQSKFPNFGKLEHIVKTPYAGLYEVVVGDKILYTDEAGLYLFDGSVIDTRSRTDLTEQRRHQLFAIDFDKLPLELAVKKVKGNGKRKLAFFTDPQCSYCKKLDKELTRINNVTLYMFMYPIFPGSDEIVRNVRCAKDPVKAWDDWMQKGIAPVQASCNTPTDKIIALGKKLRVNGTPNLIFADGTQIPGYLPAEELEKYLNQTK